MNVRSNKAKGRRLQNMVRDTLRFYFPSLEEDDIKSQTMGMTGEDVVFSPLAKKKIPYSFECKNTERIQVWDSLKQAESNSGKRVPVLIIKRNHSKIYAVIEFSKFVNLIGEKKHGKKKRNRRTQGHNKKNGSKLSRSKV